MILLHDDWLNLILTLWFSLISFTVTLNLESIHVLHIGAVIDLLFLLLADFGEELEDLGHTVLGCFRGRVGFVEPLFGVVNVLSELLVIILQFAQDSDASWVLQHLDVH